MITQKEPKLLTKIPHITPETDPVDEINNILSTKSEEDNALLLRINLYRAPEVRKKPNTEILKGTTGKVYHVSQLKKLANIYGLKLLPTADYIGPVPADLPSYVKQWASNRSFANNRFHILAPRKMFKVDVVSASDPILLYKLDDEHYEYVHHWGKDITVGAAILEFIKCLNPIWISRHGALIIIPFILIDAVFFGLACIPFTWSNSYSWWIVLEITLMLQSIFWYTANKTVDRFDKKDTKMED